MGFQCPDSLVAMSSLARASMAIPVHAHALSTPLTSSCSLASPQTQGFTHWQQDLSLRGQTQANDPCRPWKASKSHLSRKFWNPGYPRHNLEEMVGEEEHSWGRAKMGTLWRGRPRVASPLNQSKWGMVLQSDSFSRGHKGSRKVWKSSTIYMSYKVNTKFRKIHITDSQEVKNVMVAKL